MYSLRSSVFGIATTLRTGRSGDLLSVRAIDSFLLQNVMTDSRAQTSSYTMGTAAPSLPSCCEIKMSGATTLPTETHATPYG